MTMQIRTPIQIRQDLQQYAVAGEQTVLSAGQVGSCIGALSKRVMGDCNRRLVLAWLFKPDNIMRPMSSKELTCGQKYALVQWVNMYKDEAGKWQADERFILEAQYVLSAAARDWEKANVGNGQLTLDKTYMPSDAIDPFTGKPAYENKVSNCTNPPAIPENQARNAPQARKPTRPLSLVDDTLLDGLDGF